MKPTSRTQHMTMDELMALAPDPIVPQYGAVFNATVVGSDGRGGYWLDFSGKTEAHLGADEIGDAELATGAEVKAIVIEPPLEGEPVKVSIKKAQPWVNVMHLKNTGAIVAAKIEPARGQRRQKNGVRAVVEGAVGFIPCYKMGMSVDTAEKRGELMVKVAEADPAENRLIFDHIAARIELADKRDEHFAQLAEGMRVEGRVLEVVPYGCFVDIGRGKSDLRALLRNVDRLGEPLKAGDMIEAWIVRLERNRDGKPTIGLSTAEGARDEHFEALSEGDILDGVVESAVPYGYFIGIGADKSDLCGLLPNSEHCGDKLAEGQTVKVRVVGKRRTEDGKRQVTLSTTLVPERPLIERLKEGDVLTGVVSSIKDYGAFITLDKRTRLNGLAHVSEFPGGERQLYKLEVGASVTVRVVSIDRAARRVSLSFKGVSTKAA